MAQGEHRIRFSELKSRVGIDDVAYTLGYRIDRKAGVGRYIELVLGDGRDKRALPSDTRISGKCQFDQAVHQFCF